MLTDGRFWVGVGVGVAGVWAYNRWMVPRRAATARS